MKIVNPYLKASKKTVPTSGQSARGGKLESPKNAAPVKNVVQTSSSSSSIVRRTPAPDKKTMKIQPHSQEPRRITPPSKKKSAAEQHSSSQHRPHSHANKKPTTAMAINPTSMRGNVGSGGLKSKLKQQIQELKRQKKQEKLRKEMTERKKQEEARQRVLAEQRRKLEEKRQEEMRQRMLEEEAKRKQRAAEAEVKARRNEVKIVLDDLCTKVVHKINPPPAPIPSYAHANTAPNLVHPQNQMMVQPLQHQSLLHRPSYYPQQGFTYRQSLPQQQTYWAQQQNWMINQALYLQQWNRQNNTMPHNFSTQQPTAVSSSQMSSTTVSPPSSHKPKVARASTMSNNVISDVLAPPSPYASTHELLSNNPIILWKEKGQSFGMSIQIQVTSTLVDPPADESPSSTVKPSQNNDLVTAKQTSAQDSQKETITPTAAASSTQNVQSSSFPGSTGTFSTTQNSVQQKPRRRRRRRVNFGALVIIDPSKQNEKRKQHDSDSKNFCPLEIGDIIASIQGKSTAGLTFEDCCALLKQECSPSSSVSGWVSLPIEIARKRKPATPPPQAASISLPKPIHDTKRTIPFHSNPSMNTSTLIVTSAHLPVLCRMILQKATSCDRSSACWVLGAGLLKSISKVFEGHSSSAIETLIRMWAQQCQAIANHGRSLALDKAKADWSKEEVQANGTTSDSPSDSNFMSLSRRAVLKAKPRPRKGCKCGSLTHSFVSDPECHLYRNLRLLATAGVDLAESKKKTPKLDKSSLNKVGSHILDRHERQLAEKRAQEEEARFVERMENIQLQKCKQAIFAPSLSAMVLSAVLELKEGSIEDLKQVACPSEMKPDEKKQAENVEESEDEDEEGLTLADLAKRSSSASSARQRKRAKHGHRSISLSCLAQMARYISKTWGHVAQEPSHIEYAWRWEVYHGQHSPDVTWDSRASNPRRPGSFTWEPIHLQVDDKICSSLMEVDQMRYLEVDTGHDLQQLLTGDGPSLNDEHLKAISCISYVLDPSGGTGLMDEIRALMKSGVLIATENGYLRLARHWYLNVDVLLLDEFVDSWGFDHRFLMNPKIVETLKKQWILTEIGWASTAEHEDPVYDLAEFEEWKQAFEQKHETKSNEAYGINRFGI